MLAGRDVRELVAELPVVEKADLLDSSVPAVTRDGYGYDPQRGELWFAGETAEAVLLELDARRRALAEEAKLLADQAQMAERLPIMRVAQVHWTTAVPDPAVSGTASSMTLRAVSSTRPRPTGAGIIPISFVGS